MTITVDIIIVTNNQNVRKDAQEPLGTQLAIQTDMSKDIVQFQWNCTFFHSHLNLMDACTLFATMWNGEINPAVTGCLWDQNNLNSKE